ncbi:DUF6783 domain-containing protein [Eisenbergiella tayi]
MLCYCFCYFPFLPEWDMQIAEMNFQAHSRTPSS